MGSARDEWYSYKSSRADYYTFGGLGFDFKYKYWQWILVGIIGVILYYIFSKMEEKIDGLFRKYVRTGD